MFSKVPSTFFGPGYSLSGSKIQMTTATAGADVLLTKLTDAEANATTGDYREILWAVCSAFWTKWQATPVGNLPTKVKLLKTVVANPDLTTQTETYTFTFTTNTDPTNVTAEP